MQLANIEVLKEFLEEFNKPFFDSKGEQFLPIAELAFHQEVAISTPNNKNVYETSAFLQFKQIFESGEYMYDDNRPTEDNIERKSQLIASIKLEAEEEKKKEEIKRNTNKNKNWKNKNKNKKWTRK